MNTKEKLEGILFAYGITDFPDRENAVNDILHLFNAIDGCPDCGSEIMRIEEYEVCKGFGCKWQRKVSTSGDD